jgi:hypothetical protein
MMLFAVTQEEALNVTALSNFAVRGMADSLELAANLEHPLTGCPGGPLAPFIFRDVLSRA